MEVKRWWIERAAGLVGERVKRERQCTNIGVLVKEAFPWVPAHSPAPDCLSHKDNSKGRAKFHQLAASTSAAVSFVITNVFKMAKLDLRAMEGGSWACWDLLGYLYSGNEGSHDSEVLAPGCKCGKSSHGRKCAWQEEQRKWDEILGRMCCKGSLPVNIHLCSCGVMTISSPQYIHQLLTHINNITCFQKCKVLIQLKCMPGVMCSTESVYYFRDRLKLQVGLQVRWAMPWVIKVAGVEVK